ncbi:SDR family oxidoreductase [Anthocerotibacter panamensis]|uniref:SDR family oxidoreductase n=1 Tax=Anthocerotibacter panamensis TaxID=2857077 RepID=UPI001C40531B|nr:SDR family oxidoreductase [Anthocerotibacter panamensis]
MRMFVTGSTGLLGSNLIRLLTQQGHQVVALSRSSLKARRAFEDLDVQVVTGDIADIQGFAAQLAGCDVLFHTAAYFRESFQPGDHWQMLENINIKGTIQLLEAAAAHQVKKVIYVSSAGVIGMKPSGAPGDESTPPGIQAERNLYFKSKVLAEEAVFSFLRRSSLPVVLVLPGWMFGPGDAAPTSSGQLVLDYLNRNIPGILDGGAGIVDARDTAQAMLSAVERGRSGERYIVGGNFYTLAEILTLLHKVTSVPAPTLPIPRPMALAIAWGSELYSKLTGQPILISRDAVEGLQSKVWADSTKARHELGAQFRPLEETLRDEVAWYRSHGFI